MRIPSAARWASASNFLFFLCFFFSAGAAFSQPPFPNAETLSETPRIYRIERFLADWECDHIIREAAPHLKRSTVVDEKSKGGESQVHFARTSEGMFFPPRPKDRVLKDIEKRIEALTGIPSENGEAFQVLRYSVGGEYKPHYDYFDRNSPGGSTHLKRGGQRVATVLLYLNTTEEGGETIFPKAGKRVNPTKGSAVLFYNCKPDGNEDPLSLHGGAPVRKGEKWIMTKWLRQKAFN